MADLPTDARNSVARQADLFRLAEARHGLTLRSLSTLTGISASTLKGWRDGAQVPAWALGALGRAGVPDELLSLVLEPFYRHVGTDEGEGDDLDALACESSRYTAEYLEARADGNVTPMERGRLKERAGRLKAVARRAA